MEALTQRHNILSQLGGSCVDTPVNQCTTVEEVEEKEVVDTSFQRDTRCRNTSPFLMGKESWCNPPRLDRDIL